MRDVPPPPTGPQACASNALPDAEALIAGTMALMTGYSHAQPQCPMRHLMAARLARNLAMLSHHPDLSDPMKTVIGNMARRWQQAAEPEAASMRNDQSLWLPLPATVQ